MTRADIARLAPPELCLRAVRAAFRELAEGSLTTPSVAHLATTNGGFHIKTAARSHGRELVAIKVNGNFPHNGERYAMPTIQGVVLLLDGQCGAVLAIMDSAEITVRRTAACSALAAQLLASRDSCALAIIGCGTQARYHLEALSELFPFASLTLYDSAASRARELQQLASERYPAVHIAPSVSEAVVGADIVVTCTPSREPLLTDSDVHDGLFIAAVGADSSGKQELSPSLLRACKVVPDVLAQAVHMGDLQHALAAGAMTVDGVHGELADVLCGRVPGRRFPDERFVFDSTGTAVADLAVAELLYQSAHEHDERRWIGLSDDL
jgi:ornithine cyclodeaminase/alanine dehydrogenase-like protein (mu-crystallin family)